MLIDNIYWRMKMPKKHKSTHVVPDGNGGWSIKQSNAARSSGNFDTKRSAIDKARSISQNQKTELVVHNNDAKIAWKDSHGNDPYPPKG